MLFALLQGIKADMIKCQLRKLMYERDVRIADVERDTNLHRNMLTSLKDGKAKRVEVDAMNALCAYFKVGVGELFEFTPDTDAEQTSQRSAAKET